VGVQIPRKPPKQLKEFEREKTEIGLDKYANLWYNVDIRS
jgi:hypothetical protein